MNIAVEKLGAGFYRPSENFRAIAEHIAVMNEKTGELVAITGPSDPSEMQIMIESIADAVLYAGAREMFDLVKAAAADANSPQSAQAARIMMGLTEKMLGMHSSVVDMREVRHSVMASLGLAAPKPKEDSHASNI